MAESGESSSSDESTIHVVQQIGQGLEAYQYEPKRQEGAQADSASDLSADSSDTDDEPSAGDRLINSDWCLCGHCSVETLRREKECICCQEKDATRRKSEASAGEPRCVTNHEEFRLLCLTRAVLRNVLVGLNNVRADRWPVNPPQDRGFRYAAYRQFTWWIHGKIGPGRRKVIPACAVHSIRKTFPKTDDEEYEGFVSGEEDTD